MKATLVVLALDEIDGMQAIMPRIDPEWCHQVIVVDGGSSDGTAEWARQKGYIVHVQERPGVRQACKEVWDLIEGDVVITFNPDGNSIPEKIPELMAKIEEGHDMVIASRYLGEARSDDDDLLTGFGNWFFTRTVNLLFGAKYTDVMVLFRAYRKNLIAELGLDRDDAFTWVERLWRTGPPGSLHWDPLLAVRARIAGCRIAEIPASEPARIGGYRKLRVFSWGGAVYLQFIREFLRPYRRCRPAPD